MVEGAAGRAWAGGYGIAEQSGQVSRLDKGAPALLDDGDAKPRSDEEAALPRAVPAKSAARPEACPHCQGRVLWRWGETGRGLQRWRCRDCRRSCSALSGTVIAGIHDFAKLELLIQDMARPHPQSCRSLARALELDKSTVWRWRKKVCESLIAEPRAPVAAATDRCRAVFRESRKASREWLRHAREPERFHAPDRLQWFAYRRLALPLPQPMARYRIVVDCAADADRGHRLTVLGSEERLGATCNSSLPAADGGAMADAGRSQNDLGQGCKPCRHTGASERPAAGPAARAGEALRTFLRPFRGPATRHLAGYAAWLETRLGRCEAAQRRSLAAHLVVPAGGPQGLSAAR